MNKSIVVDFIKDHGSTIDSRGYAEGRIISIDGEDVYYGKTDWKEVARWFISHRTNVSVTEVDSVLNNLG